MPGGKKRRVTTAPASCQEYVGQMLPIQAGAGAERVPLVRAAARNVIVVERRTVCLGLNS